MTDTSTFVVQAITSIMLIVYVIFSTPDYRWQAHAIKRGYAIYCPVSGDFAWKGECK